MNYKTHIATSLALGASVCTVAPISFTVTYAAGILLGSVLPDIDEPSSVIGKRTFGLSRVIKRYMGHRGFTHSLLAWLLLTFFCYSNPTSFLVGLSLGYLFHIIGDFFSVASVPLFLPFTKWRLRNMPFAYRTDSKVEKWIMTSSMVAFIYFFVTDKLYITLTYSILDILLFSSMLPLYK